MLEKARAHIKGSSLRLIRDAANGEITLSRQGNYPAIAFPALNEASGKIDPSIFLAKDVINIIRSCSSPFPGSYLYVQDNNTKIRIWKAEINEDIKDLEIGYARIMGKALFIRCKDKAIKVNDFEFESTKAYNDLEGADFFSR
ncbi:hypothetical protein OAS65_02780 [Methylophilaceae bacterium]|nr:hypothetical protein [Methylophilaceae bacterium]